MTPHIPRTPASRRPSERGAVLIHVSIALLAVAAFSAFVVDQGIMWIARAQAQNAADAAALAGASSLAFDDSADLPRARAATIATGRVNPVWGQAADVVDADITIGACPPDAPGIANTCVRANVYRNQVKHPLPTTFLQLSGVSQQGVQAMATAQVMIANAVNCLRPFALIDKWDEVKPGPAGWHSGRDGFTASTFDRYKIQGNRVTLLAPAPLDSYSAPSLSGPGSGFAVVPSSGPTDYGRQLALKAGKSNDSVFPAGWFMPLDVGSGTRDYKGTIKACSGAITNIGDTLTMSSEPGNKVNKTAEAAITDADSLFNLDPSAIWDASLNGGKGGVRNSAYPVSPRVIPVPLISIDDYINGIPTGKTTVRITNIIGAFVEGLDAANNVLVRITNYPGLPGGGNTVGGGSSFLKTVLLVR